MIWGRGGIAVGHSKDTAKNSGIQDLNAQDRPQSRLEAVTIFSRPKKKSPKKWFNKVSLIRNKMYNHVCYEGF